MWTRSSFCANAGCVEVEFRKASRSGQFDCVEVGADAGGTVHVRDSKDPDGPCLQFTQKEWSAFRAGVKAGEFDLPA